MEGYLVFQCRAQLMKIQLHRQSSERQALCLLIRSTHSLLRHPSHRVGTAFMGMLYGDPDLFLVVCRKPHLPSHFVCHPKG